MPCRLTLSPVARPARGLAPTASKRRPTTVYLTATVVTRTAASAKNTAFGNPERFATSDRGKQARRTTGRSGRDAQDAGVQQCVGSQRGDDRVEPEPPDQRAVDQAGHDRDAERHQHRRKELGVVALGMVRADDDDDRDRSRAPTGRSRPAGSRASARAPRSRERTRRAACPAACPCSRWSRRRAARRPREGPARAPSSTGHASRRRRSAGRVRSDSAVVVMPSPRG